MIGTLGGAPDGRLPWADIGLPRWGGNPKRFNALAYAAGGCVTQLCRKIDAMPREEARLSDGLVTSFCRYERFGRVRRRTLPNPAAAQHAVAVVQHESLTGSDSELRLLEAHGHFVTARFDPRGSGRV